MRQESESHLQRGIDRRHVGLAEPAEAGGQAQRRGRSRRTHGPHPRANRPRSPRPAPRPAVANRRGPPGAARAPVRPSRSPPVPAPFPRRREPEPPLQASSRGRETGSQPATASRRLRCGSSRRRRSSGLRSASERAGVGEVIKGSRVPTTPREPASTHSARAATKSARSDSVRSSITMSSCVKVAGMTAGAGDERSMSSPTCSSTNCEDGTDAPGPDKTVTATRQRIAPKLVLLATDR